MTPPFTRGLWPRARLLHPGSQQLGPLPPARLSVPRGCPRPDSVPGLRGTTRDYAALTPGLASETARVLDPRQASEWTEPRIFRFPVLWPGARTHHGCGSAVLPSLKEGRRRQSSNTCLDRKVAKKEQKWPRAAGSGSDVTASRRTSLAKGAPRENSLWPGRGPAFCCFYSHSAICYWQKQWIKHSKTKHQNKVSMLSVFHYRFIFEHTLVFKIICFDLSLVRERYGDNDR